MASTIRQDLSWDEMAAIIPQGHFSAAMVAIIEAESFWDVMGGTIRQDSSPAETVSTIRQVRS